MNPLFEMTIPLALFFAVLFFGYILRKILFTRLSKWASRTKSQIDDIILAAAKGPFIIWCIMLGIYFALEASKLPQEVVNISGKILLVLGITSVTLVLANISSKLVRAYSDKLNTALPVTSLTQNITRIVIFGIGIFILTPINKRALLS